MKTWNRQSLRLKNKLKYTKIGCLDAPQSFFYPKTIRKDITNVDRTVLAGAPLEEITCLHVIQQRFQHHTFSCSAALLRHGEAHRNNDRHLCYMALTLHSFLRCHWQNTMKGNSTWSFQMRIDENLCSSIGLPNLLQAQAQIAKVLRQLLFRQPWGTRRWRWSMQRVIGQQRDCSVHLGGKPTHPCWYESPSQHSHPTPEKRPTVSPQHPQANFPSKTHNSFIVTTPTSYAITNIPSKRSHLLPPSHMAWRSLATTESGHLRPQTKKQDLGHLWPQSAVTYDHKTSHSLTGPTKPPQCTRSLVTTFRGHLRPKIGITWPH